LENGVKEEEHMIIRNCDEHLDLDTASRNLFPVLQYARELRLRFWWNLIIAGLVCCLLNVAVAQAQTKGIVPPEGQATSTPAAQQDVLTSDNGIQFNGGSVMRGPHNIYFIWYGNWDGNTATTLLPAFIAGLNGSSYFATNTTYGDNIGNIDNTVSMLTQVFDSYSQGSVLTDATLESAVLAQLTSGALPTDSNGIYFVLSSADVDEQSGTDEFCVNFCGFHTSAILNGSNIKYAWVGNPDRCPTKCEHQQSTSPNDNPGADAMASSMAHELNETVTDPDSGGWFRQSLGPQGEVGDLCVSIYGPSFITSNGSQANLILNGKNFLVQENWVNAAGGFCAMTLRLAEPLFNPPTMIGTPPAEQVQFSWSQVPNNSGYRIMVATSRSALPTDPDSGVCVPDNSACIMNDNTIAKDTTVFTTSPGELQSGTTYFWQVRALATSPLEPGFWSAPSPFSLTFNLSITKQGSGAGTVTSSDGVINCGASCSAMFGAGTTVVLTASPISGATFAGWSGACSGTGTCSVSMSGAQTVTATFNQTLPTGPVLSSLTITPSNIVGGFSPQGVVTLTGPAPAGATVFLHSNNETLAQVPSQVDVTAGFNTRAFPITTFFTSGTQGATITANYNNTLTGASLTVLPVGISGVSFFPANVTAGTPAAFTVFLNGPAAAGTFVSLVSSDPSVLQVPSSVPLPTGATSVSVTGTTSPVAVQTSVTLTATYNLNSGQASLTVVPAPPITLNSFSFSPGTITGGSSVSGTVFLTGAAPAGGAAVSISSSSGLVPSISVTVPAGSVSAPFTLTSGGVSTVTNVSLTASYGGISQTGTLTLVPPLPFLASLSFSPPTIDSGLTATCTVTLTAPAPLGGASISLANDSSFSIAAVPNNTLVPAGATSATFTVRTSPIQFIARVTVTASYNGSPAKALLTIVPPGTPTGPSSVSLSPSTVVSGTQSAGTIQLTNPAPAGELLVSLASDNTSASVPLSITVPAGATSAAFSLATLPVTGISTATITVSSNGVSQSTLLTLTPTGPAPAGSPVPLLTVPLAPVSQTPGATDFTFTIKGTRFAPGARVLLDGNPLATTFVNSSTLQTVLPEANARSNFSGAVSVANNGSLASSNRLPLHLTFPTSSPAFTNSSLSLTGSPRGAAFADFNRDGKLDMVVGKSDGTGITVLLGNGDGTFGPELLLPAIDPFSVIAGDFNGDGKPDIAAICGSVVLVFLGNGDGTFTNGPRISIPSSSGNDLVASDLNADGRLDLAVTGAPGVWVLLGNGDGTFQSPANFGTVAFPTSIAAADFNQDGKLDLVVNDSPSQSVAILLGNGDGTFQAQNEVSTNGFANSLTIADFNGDGFPDIAVANQGPFGSAGAGLAVLLGRGDGTFSPAVNYFAGENFFFVTTDDMNGDGKLDLLAVPPQFARSSNILVLGNGDGTFSGTPIPVGGTPQGSPLFIADVNGDGAPDVLVTTSASGSLPLLIQSISPIIQATPATLSFEAIQGGTAPATAQLTIANTGGGSEAWTATASVPWISLSQSTGTAPSTVSVTADQSNLVPGTYNGSISLSAPSASNSPKSIEVTLNIQPAPVVLASLSFSPNTLTGVGTTLATIALNAAAPSGGVVVNLASDSTAVQVPAAVTVPAGATFVTATANVAAVVTPTSVTITATYNQISTTAFVTLSPAAPAADLSTTSLGFVSQQVGVASPVASATLSNSGTAVLGITSIALTGPNASDFSQSNTCGLALAAGANCTISIVFTPSASGTRTASVTLTDSLGVQSIALTGTGIAPAISFSSTALTFPSQLVGTSSMSQAITVQNTGTAPLPITSVALGGADARDFSETNTCGTNLLDGASCTITIVFTPTAAGSQIATVVLTDSLGVQTIDLTGTSVAPAVSLSAVTLPFANQPVSTSSAPQAVVMQNTGTAPLPITSISLTGPNAGDFSQTNTCGTSLSAGASCSVSVIFTPSSFGNKTAALVLTDSVGTQSVDVSGTGTAALAALSPASLTFPNQPVGTPSAAQVISLTNGGNIALSVTSISVTGVNSSDFAQTNMCGTSVAAGSTCTINVVFTPSSTGSKSASIAVVDSIGTQTTTVGGIGTAPAVSLSSSNLVFANQTVGTSSTAQAVTLTNSGNGALSISSISISGTNVTDFAQTNTCGTSVAAGANCTISITFVPTAAGTRTAAVTIVDNAGTQSISLTGTGVAAGPAVQLTPTSLSFGVQPVGVASSVRAINVANTGDAALSITSISLAGTNGTDFTQTNTCGTSVGAGGTCTISVTFKPAAAGPRSAAITLQDGIGTQTVPLDGIGQAPLDFLPTSIAFGNQALGSTSTTRIVTLTNNTGVLVNFSSIVVTGANAGDFIQLSTTCGQTLAWTSSCTVTLAFAPVGTGTRSASLTIIDDATNNPQSVALSGSGILPVTVTASISFGSQKVGRTSASKTVTIKNNLPTMLTFSTFSFGGTNPGDFQQSATTCGSILAAGASCTVSIVFTPTATGFRNAVLNIVDNAVTSPQSVMLTGTGK
jgi:hypothetical protein